MSWLFLSLFLSYVYSRLMDQIPVMEYHTVLFTDLAESDSLPIILITKARQKFEYGLP